MKWELISEMDFFCFLPCVIIFFCEHIYMLHSSIDLFFYSLLTVGSLIHLQHILVIIPYEGYVLQVVYNANELQKLVKKKKSKQNWLAYNELRYEKNPTKRPTKKVKNIKYVMLLLLKFIFSYLMRLLCLFSNIIM